MGMGMGMGQAMMGAMGQAFQHPPQPQPLMPGMAPQVDAGVQQIPVPAAIPAPAPAGDTKFCSNCGNKIPRAAKFCSECGSTQ